MDTYRYWMPTEVVFGAGCVESLAAHSAQLGRRPFVVTGRRSARASGALDRVLGQLPDAVVYDQVDENPTTAACETGAGICTESGCDYVVALGGGSPMDAAKGIAVLARNPAPCRQYFGSDQFQGGALPIIAIPTTAGTGSEVTPYSVLVDPDGPVKRTVGGRALFPFVALLDPTLTVSLPRSVTIHTGLDVLSQAMEGMLSRKSTPVGDSLAVEACRLVREWLPRAADAPGNLDARGAMLHAAMLSGCIIAQSGTTLVHGLGYYYTLHCGVAHGLANALLLAPVFAINALHAPAKVAALASALGKPCAAEPAAAAAGISAALHALFTRLGMSPAARDHGVREDLLQRFAEDVIGDPYRFKNQFGAWTLDMVRAALEQSLSGSAVRGTA